MTSGTLTSSSQPRYMVVYEHLRQMILQGRLTPNSQIDTETLLARQFRVSVGTIRKAQDLLIRDGLLIKRQGSGTYIAPGASDARQILWVCGLDIFDSDISHTYTQWFRCCRRFAAKESLSLQPLWLSNDRPDDWEPHVTPQALRRYLGMVFVGCEYPKHGLLRLAVSHNLCHVHFSREEPRPGRIVLNYRQAVADAIRRLRDHGHQRIEVVVLGANLARELRHPLVLDAMAGTQVRCHLLEPTDPRMTAVESDGYLAMGQILREPGFGTGLLIVDDIVARGATRALLEHRDRLPRQPEVIVMTSIQCAVPFGMPVTYLVYDAEEESRQAIQILVERLRHPQQPLGFHVSDLRFMSLEQILVARGADAASDAPVRRPILLSS